MKRAPGIWPRSFYLLALLAATAVRAADTPLPHEFAGASPLQWSVHMADSEIMRRGESLIYRDGGAAKWSYAVGLFTLSLVRLSEQVDEPRYWKYADSVIGSFVTPEGQVRDYRLEDYNLDNLNAGKTVLALYRLTKQERYQQAAVQLRKQFTTHPRTSEGGFWHKQRYPSQMWLDGLYMGEPFYAECAQLFRESAGSFDDIAKQFRLAGTHTYDAATGLFYHGWDESKAQSWANKTTGTSPNFWSRGIGWYAMALVDTLDYFPADHPARPEIIAMLQKVCAGAARYQDAGSGLWYQVTDQGGRQGNYLEATGSSMFVYTMAKGINHGYLSRDYLPVILKGYTGLVEKLIKVDKTGRITLTQCCSVAGLGYGRDGSYEYYLSEPVVDNDLKGVGPFILAGIELQQLLGLTPTIEAAAKTADVAAPARSPAAPEWATVAEILARIKAPAFPAREFAITDYGAVADGMTECTEAIRKAIEACHEAGGGRVTVSAAGIFLTGPIHLKSNVDLHVAEGATPEVPVGSRQVSAGCLHPLGRHGMSQLLTLHLCLRAGEHRRDRRGHARRRGNGGQLVGVDPAWQRRGAGQGQPGSAERPGRAGRAGGAARLRRGPFSTTQLHPALPLPQCSDRGRAHPPLPDVGDQSRALHQRHRARRRHCLRGPEQ